MTEPHSSSLTHASRATASVDTVGDLCGEQIVIDVRSPFVFLGTLDRVTETFAILADADAHDLRETKTTREAYVLDAVRFGLNVNRAEVWVRWDEVVCVSRLADVVV